MGGRGSGRVSITNQILQKAREEKSTVASNKNILGDFIIPNQSGDNSAGTILSTPVNDIDMVNKGYVDSADVLKLDLDGGNANQTINLQGEILQTDNIIQMDELRVLKLGSETWAEMKIANANAATNTGCKLSAYQLAIDSTWPLGHIEFKETSSSNSSMLFYTSASRTDTLALTIDNNQNAAFTGDLTVDTNTLHVDSANDKVGIGLTDPLRKFHVYSSVSAGARVYLEADSGDNGPGLEMAFDRTATRRGLIRLNEVGSTGTEIAFFTVKDGSYITEKMVLEDTGALALPKSKLTELGGYAIRLTNKTGANSVAGGLVETSDTTNDAVKLMTANGIDPIGVFLDAGIADGSEAWVVVGGIADVAMEDNTAATRNNWVGVSASEAGYADATAASPANQTRHFQEIGHCIESVAAGGAGTHILARCVLHFN